MSVVVGTSLNHALLELWNLVYVVAFLIPAKLPFQEQSTKIGHPETNLNEFVVDPEVVGTQNSQRSLYRAGEGDVHHVVGGSSHALLSLANDYANDGPVLPKEFLPLQDLHFQ